MTKVTMPEPVAEVCSDYALHWAGSGPIAPLCERTGAKVGSLLITTTQAEAYKDACVREALELAADTCAGIAIPTSHDAPNKQVALECALAIRALLPSTPARPESEQ